MRTRHPLTRAHVVAGRLEGSVLWENSGDTAVTLGVTQRVGALGACLRSLP